MEKSMVLTKKVLREIQLTELEIAVEVDRICQKGNIKYSLDGGTLLGAVRHGGFIPWDNDMDIIFTRAEYDKFFRLCQTALDHSRFFLQEYRTDPYYRWGYAKIRRKGTEFIRMGQEHMRYRTGVAIDVFVLDHVPDSFFFRRCHFLMNNALRKILYSELGKKAEEHIYMRCLYSLLEFIPRDFCFWLRDTISRFLNRYKTTLIGHLLFPYPEDCKYGIPADLFNEYEEIFFEGMMFSAVKSYDRYLTLLYGDYMTLPPIEERVAHLSISDLHLLPITLEQVKMRYRQQY